MGNLVNFRTLSMLLLVLLVASCGKQKELEPVRSSQEQKLEKGLIEALSMSSENKRKAESGPALVAYIKQGHLHRKPDYQQDYNDYRYPLKPMHLFGHKILLIDEEYITKYLGCCVDEGLAITVESAGPSIESFAKNNGCTIKNDPYLPDEVKEKLPKDGWYTLSCKENDTDR